MAQRYLFGPVTAAFAEEKLGEQRRAGACLTFNHTGDADLLVGAADDRGAFLTRLPDGAADGWFGGRVPRWLAQPGPASGAPCGTDAALDSPWE